MVISFYIAVIKINMKKKKWFVVNNYLPSYNEWIYNTIFQNDWGI